MARNFKTYLTEGKYIWLAFVFIGLVGIDYGFYIQIKEKNAREWPTTVALMEESKVTVSQTSGDKPTYRPMVRFSYSVNGTSYIGTKIFLGITVGIGNRKTIEKQLEPYYRGMRVKIFYNPQHPDEACLELDGPAKYFGFCTGFFVLSLGLLAFTQVEKVLRNEPFQKWFNIVLWMGLGVSIYLGTCLYRDYRLNEWMLVSVTMITGLSLGMGTAYVSLLLLKFKRRMENIPTSKIATGAVGSNVEIVGKISDGSRPPFRAPVSKTSCSFYFVKIEEQSQDKENSWATLCQFGPRPWFCVEDDSKGLALVVHDEAELHLRWSDVILSRKDGFKEVVDALRSDLRDEGTFGEIYAMEWFSPGRVYRISECVLLPDDEVYVFGYAQSGLDLSQGDQAAPNPYDGTVADQKMAQVAGSAILSQGISQVAGKLASRAQRIKMVFQKHDEKQGPFVLSNKSEKELANVFNRETQIYFVCGSAMVVSHFLGLIMLIF